MKFDVIIRLKKLDYGLDFQKPEDKATVPGFFISGRIGRSDSVCSGVNYLSCFLNFSFPILLHGSKIEV